MTKSSFLGLVRDARRKKEGKPLLRAATFWSVVVLSSVASSLGGSTGTLMIDASVYCRGSRFGGPAPKDSAEARAWRPLPEVRWAWYGLPVAVKLVRLLVTRWVLSLGEAVILMRLDGLMKDVLCGVKSASCLEVVVRSRG